MSAEVIKVIKYIIDSKFGQLGLGDQYVGRNYKLPKICSYKLIIKKISCGSMHSCFITQRGHIYSMGSNEFGQLGLSDPTIKYISYPSLIERLVNQKCFKIKCGSNYSIAKNEKNELYSWGQGQYGALGLTTRENQFQPKKITIIFNRSDEYIIKFSCGDRHTAFISNHGNIYMTGSNESGQCGVNSNLELLSPVLVKLDLKCSKVACGYSHTLLALQTSTHQNQLFSFGCNQFGQLGIGKNQEGGYHLQQLDLMNISKIKASNFSAALTKNSEFFIWGSGIFGEFFVPRKIMLPKNVQFQTIQLGTSFGFALAITGHVYSFGKNNNGELAQGDYQPRINLTHVSALKNKHVLKIACGYNFVICLSPSVREKLQDEYRHEKPRSILKKANINDRVNSLQMNTENDTELSPSKKDTVMTKKQFEKRSHSFDLQIKQKMDYSPLPNRNRENNLTEIKDTIQRKQKVIDEQEMLIKSLYDQIEELNQQTNYFKSLYDQQNLQNQQNQQKQINYFEQNQRLQKNMEEQSLFIKKLQEQLEQLEKLNQQKESYFNEQNRGIQKSYEEQQQQQQKKYLDQIDQLEKQNQYYKNQLEQSSYQNKSLQEANNINNEKQSIYLIELEQLEKKLVMQMKFILN